MDLSKPDTLCVYCGSNLEKVTAEELARAISGRDDWSLLPERPQEIYLKTAAAILEKYEVRRR